MSIESNKEALLATLEEMISLAGIGDKSGLTGLMPQFRVYLREYRTAKRITRPELALALSVSAQTVYRWEQVDSSPPPKLDSLLRLRSEIKSPTANSPLSTLRDNSLVQPLEGHIAEKLSILDSERRTVFGFEKPWPYEAWLLSPQILMEDDIKRLKIVLEAGVDLHIVYPLDLICSLSSPISSLPKWRMMSFIRVCVALGEDLSEGDGFIVHHPVSVWSDEYYKPTDSRFTEIARHKKDFQNILELPASSIPRNRFLSLHAVEGALAQLELKRLTNNIAGVLVWHAQPGLLLSHASYIVRVADSKGGGVLVGATCPKSPASDFVLLVDDLREEESC